MGRDSGGFLPLARPVRRPSAFPQRRMPLSTTTPWGYPHKTAKNPRKVIQPGPPPEPDPTPVGTIPRVSRLMALAIRFDRLIKSGEIEDRAELARLGNVTRARVTQIMTLLHLAPDIQEDILHLPRTERGDDPIRERDVRRIAMVMCWCEQRQLWHKAAAESALSVAEEPHQA